MYMYYMYMYMENAVYCQHSTLLYTCTSSSWYCIEKYRSDCTVVDMLSLSVHLSLYWTHSAVTSER